jgi:hypothetical protein
MRQLIRPALRKARQVETGTFAMKTARALV